MPGQAGADPSERRLHPGAGTFGAPQTTCTFRLPDVHFADRELVGAGVAIDGHDLAHHDAAELRAERLVSLHLDAGHGEAISERLPRHRRIAERAQPALGNVH